MHAPPPPLPNLDPVSQTAVVRQATPEEVAWSTRKTDVARSAAEFYDKMEKAAEALVKDHEARQRSSTQIDEATRMQSDEARQPVLDERVTRRRPQRRRRR
ncbi:MAG: hypothetical protein ACRDOK_05380 [Streptosporangiaceae bacterium]